MTLVQVLANDAALHMACDFRLTDFDTGEVRQEDAHKLVTINKAGWSGIAGFTGVANLGGTPTGTWIARQVADIGPLATFQETVQSLASAATKAVAGIPSDRNYLTLVVGAVLGSQVYIGLASNFEHVSNHGIKRDPKPRSRLSVSVTRPKKPRLFLTGDAFFKSGKSRVKSEHEVSLIRKVRARASDDEIHDLMRQVNVSLAGGLIGEGCHVASVHASGHGFSRTFLTDAQPGDFIPPEFELELSRLGLKINPKMGADGKPEPMQLHSSGVARSNPSRNFFREQFKIRRDDAELHNNYGVWLEGEGKYDDAIRSYRQALRLKPGYGIALSNLAGLLGRRASSSAEVDEATDLFGVALADPSVSRGTMAAAALFMESQGRLDEARRWHEQSALDGAPLFVARLGSFLARHTTNVDHGWSLLQQAAEQAPNSGQVLFLKGMVQWAVLGRLDEARPDLERAASLRPRDASIQKAYADVLLIQKDAGSAVFFYRRAIGLLEPGRTREHARINYGLALLRSRKAKAAITQLVQASNALPESVEAKVNLGAALYVARQREDAIVLMKHLLEVATPLLELELIAMLLVASHADGQPSPRLSERVGSLLESGVRCDATTIRCMAQDSRDHSHRGFIDVLARNLEDGFVAAISAQ